MKDQSTQPLAVVTGAVKPGYGQAVADRLLSDGYRVIGTYSIENKELVPSFIKQRSNIEAHHVDLSSRESIDGFIDELQGDVVDSLVFADAFWHMEDGEAEYDQWSKSVSVNLVATNYISRKIVKQMKPGASIVDITSTEGFVGSFGGSAYAAARSGEHSLVKSLANVMGAKGVRVNAVAPGWIGGFMDDDEIFNKSLDQTPLGRLGRGEEVANVVSFLTSDEASYITGSTVTVDGGYSGVDVMAKYEYELSLKS